MLSPDRKNIIRKVMNECNVHDVLVAIMFICRGHAAAAEWENNKLYSLEWQHVAALIERVADTDSVRDVSEKQQLKCEKD